MSNQGTDRTKLTFSQAEGINPLPKPAALGTLSQEARASLWNTTYQSLLTAKKSSIEIYPPMEDCITDPWKKILHHYHTSYLYKPTDEFTTDFAVHKNDLNNLFMKGEYNRVFDFLQVVLRHRPSPYKFRDAVASVLEHCMCAYAVVEDGPTIVPIALPEQRESVQKAFQVLKSGPFEGARSHLRKAVKCINDGDPAGSVRESIHAVESVAKRLNADAATSLKPALDALSQKVAIHGAFKEGIGNLHAGTVNGVALCRMFNCAIRWQPCMPNYLSSDHDPLYRFGQWQANLRILEVIEIKTVPYVPLSHPFVERLIGTIRREYLDRTLFWTTADLENKLLDFRTYFNAYRSHTGLEGRTPDPVTPIPRPVARLHSYGWQRHCRGLYHTPMTA